MGKLCLIPFFLFFLWSCQPHDHEEDHGHGHSHGNESAGHEHGETEATQISLWNDRIELFMEHEPFVAGTPTRLITHVTYLENWLPRTEGEIELLLSSAGREPLTQRVPTPARDGIYLPDLTFPSAGSWQVTVKVPLPDGASSQSFEATVYPSQHDAEHATPPAAPEGIAFLKEQQWRMPFDTHAVSEETFHQTISANGTITPHSSGEVVVLATVAGRLRADANYPFVGGRVSAGQKLVRLIPRLAQLDDPAALTQDLRRAESAYAFAEQEHARQAGLLKQGTVPEQNLRDAELQVALSKTDLEAARARLEQIEALQASGDNRAGIDLTAPLSGTVMAVFGVPGAWVEEGEPLFRITDLSKVWLEVHVPESDIGRVRDAREVTFATEDGQRFEARLDNGGRLVAMGGEVDPIARTLPLIFEVPNPEGRLKIGMYARVSVLTGGSSRGLSIPVEAIVEESGQEVVYVQLGGETFERRTFWAGMRDRDRVQVLDGLAAGERVVTTGAYQIRLAGATDAVPAHGHAH